jgi:type II secretory pathway pseudopilin PulG
MRESSAEPGSGPKAGQGGFTLLEFLVAFAILTMFIASMLIGIGVALRGDNQAAFVLMATAAAKSKLSSIAAEPVLQPGTSTGYTADRLLWRTTVHPYGLVRIAPDRVLQGYWIDVAISDPSRQKQRVVSISGFEIRPGVRP